VPGKREEGKGRGNEGGEEGEEGEEEEEEGGGGGCAERACWNPRRRRMVTPLCQ